MERVYSPINAVSDLVTLILKPPDAGSSLLQLGFQLTHARLKPSGGIAIRPRHTSFASSTPRPRHVPLSAARCFSRIPRMTYAHTPQKNLGGSSNRSQLDNQT